MGDTVIYGTIRFPNNKTARPFCEAFRRFLRRKLMPDGVALVNIPEGWHGTDLCVRPDGFFMTSYHQRLGDGTWLSEWWREAHLEAVDERTTLWALQRDVPGCRNSAARNAGEK